MISVIIPVYKTPIELIERCFRSVSEQTYRNIEVIVVNDGSQQAELEKYMQEYSLTDNRFHIINQINSGVSAARNNAIDAAEGEFIIFVDSDDCLTPNALQTALDTIERYNADVAIGGIEIIEENKVQKCSIQGDKTLVYEKEQLWKIQNYILSSYYDKSNLELKGLRCRGPWCKLIRRSALGNHRFQKELPVYEDIIFNVKLIETVKRVIIVPEVWYRYYIYQDSVMRKYHPDGFKEQQRVIEVLHELSIKHPELLNALAIMTADCVRKTINTTLYHKQSDIQQKKKKLKAFLNENTNYSLIKHINIWIYPDITIKNRIFYLLCKYRQVYIFDMIYGRKDA